MTQDRAKYLLANTLMGGDLRYAFRLGSLSHRLYDDGMLRSEYEAVRALWVTMPGSASLYAALCEVAAGRMVCPPRLACEACGCTGQPHYFVWTGGETLCVDCG